MGKSKQKKRLDWIKNKVQNVKNNNLQARTAGKFINFIESNELLQDIGYCKITHKETLKRRASIRDDIKTTISQNSLNSNQIEVITILFIIDKIFTGKIKMIKKIAKLSLMFLKKKN